MKKRYYLARCTLRTGVLLIAFLALFVLYSGVFYVPAYCSEPCTIEINAGQIIHPEFGGVGFHVFHHLHSTTQRHIDEVLNKRWREMNPAFARVTDNWNWTEGKMDSVAYRLKELKNTGTEIYMTTWGPKDVPPGAERKAYAARIVDNLEYLIRDKGMSNIKYYCMTNEMTLGGWGTLRSDLPTFRDYHRELFEELNARDLDVKLLATDEAVVHLEQRWPTIPWAVENMDDITGVYGAHHYEYDRPPEDLEFYPQFLEKMTWASGWAGKVNKNFILGEFGLRMDGRYVNGMKLDVNRYFDTPDEKMLPLQVAEMALGSINGGVYGMGYWTFADFPDARPGQGYLNKWGMFKWTGADYSTRGIYYAYGLLTRFFRGPATVFSVESSDELVRAAALQHHDGKTYSVAVVNRKNEPVPLSLSIKDSWPVHASFRKYEYDTADIPFHPFGDMQGPCAKVNMFDGGFQDTVKPMSLTVYTTAYDEDPPESVKGLSVNSEPDGMFKLTWQPSTEKDFCYYRIYKSYRPEFTLSVSNQIGSTTAEEFSVTHDRYIYKVTAVDQSGNESEPAVSRHTVEKR